MLHLPGSQAPILTWFPSSSLGTSVRPVLLPWFPAPLAERMLRLPNRRKNSPSHARFSRGSLRRVRPRRVDLAIGGIAVAVAAAAAERILAAAAFRRALWQSAILGVYVLMIIEATGLSRAVSVLWGRIGDAPIEQAAGNSEPRVSAALVGRSADVCGTLGDGRRLGDGCFCRTTRTWRGDARLSATLPETPRRSDYRVALPVLWGRWPPYWSD